ncbi:cell division protein FtsA [Sphingosinicella ginsenosidimutans]|uniref:Cell division protein FtsA n=1 Tax=Allosphingosinicella ginsenosidimutans TaxID=1176539 RepID=A0A5C6TQG9_9SPHN|nr:cell division protein FtsA [Sphingosinicella ginsenosidimutans]TXC62697.1 cell division protein FtsA [Sphingosinicella ginsenosidimutans]
MRRPTPAPARSLVAALDVGSSKVSALIAEPAGEGRLKILGTGQRESKGVRRGFIADMEKSELAIREAVEQAERIAGTNIDQVFVGFSAGGLVSDVASVELAIGGRRIADADIDSLLDAGKNSIDPAGRMLLHAMPALYTIDGMNGVRKPNGLHADKLAVDIHVVAADPSPVKNLDLCVRSAHLGVEAIVASPVAAGKACLSEEERELGVALVELGAGVTNVSVFAGGMLAGLKSLATGASDITDDIAAAFGTRRNEAERIKCFYGSAMMSPRDNHDMIELAPIAGHQEGIETQRITRAQLVTVIRQRLEHLASEIEAALKDLGFAGPFGRQVVLTGGGAELKGIADYAQGVLGRAVRVGRPAMPGLPDAHSGPAFSTLAGLAQFAASDELDLRTGFAAPQVEKAGGNVVQRLIAAFRTQY